MLSNKNIDYNISKLNKLFIPVNKILKSNIECYNVLRQILLLISELKYCDKMVKVFIFNVINYSRVFMNTPDPD